MNITAFIPFGKENAISRQALSLAVYGEISSAADRKIREKIEKYRLGWAPLYPFICSEPTGKGYWLTYNTVEIRRFRNKYNTYRESEGRVIENIDRQLARIDGTGMVYVKGHYRRVKGAS